MNTLVQSHIVPPHLQSATMNFGDPNGRQQRPTNNPSRNLQNHELQCLYSVLGENCVTLATAVAQVFHGYNGTWRKQACGVFCFVKDYVNRTYCFRLYDLRLKSSIYEETVPAILRLEKSADVFYTFDGTNCRIGINFVDRDEAQTFSHYFHSKQEERLKKKDKKRASVQPRPSPPIIPLPVSPAVSNLATGIRPPISVAPQPPSIPVNVPMPNKKISSTKSGFLTIGRSKKKNSRPDISAPIASTLVHVGHIGTKESFFLDDSQKQIFEQVLTNLGISAEDKNYVRDFISTQGGIEKLLHTPVAPAIDANGHVYQVANAPPEVPPRNQQTLSKSNGGRAPHQDISSPTSYNQSSSRPPLSPGVFTPPSNLGQPAPPIIPPRPGPRGSDNGFLSNQAPSTPPPPPPPPPFPSAFNSEYNRSHPPCAPPPPPPPPMPSSLMNPNGGYTAGSPPPPPPPPPPTGLSGSTTKSIAPPASSSARDNLLEDIRKAGTTRLKPPSERPAIPSMAPPTETSSGVQDAMAKNILKILAERREKLRGPEVTDESDSSESEWVD